MGFLNEIMLFGLAGVAVPVLIHLLNRYRYREIDWGAMELLRRAMVVRSRRVRIEDLILLILRCLAVALIAMSMARPSISVSGAKFFGGESRVAAVIAVDGSYSMDHRPGVRSRFDAAMQKARQIVRTLQPGDQVSVVLMGQRPRTLLRNVSYDEQRIDEHLAAAAPLPERLNLEPGLEQAAALVAEARAPVRECYVISDSQDLSWRQLSDRARESMAEMARSGRLYYLSAATGGAANVALTDFRMVSGARRAGAMVRYVAEVRNSGAAPVRNVPVTLTLDHKTADRRVIDVIQPGRAVAVPLYAKLASPGNVQITAQLERDALAVDDVRHAAVHVRERIRVLVVDGDSGGPRGEGGAEFLMKALVPDPSKPSQASIAARRVAQVELGLHRLDEQDIIILSNVSGVRAARAKELGDFVRQGGGLVVFLGDKVSGPLLNAQMTVDGEPLLPAAIGRAVEAGRGQEGGWAIEPADPRHPLGRLLASLPGPLVGEARVRKLFALEPHDGARAVLNVAGGDLPLLLERRLGRGVVLLSASSADRRWGTVPINPAFLILLHESVAHLTRQSHERQFTVGEPLVVRLPAQGEAEQFMLAGPDGASVAIQATEIDGQRAADCGLPEMPGFYQLKVNKDSEPIMTAVNVDPVESDVRSLTADELRTALGAAPIRILPGENIAEEVKQGRTGYELWRILMLIGLAVLCVEGLLAWHFSRKLEQETSALPKTAREAIRGEKEAA